MSWPPAASGRQSGPAAGALGRAAGRRPTLAGNVSPGDAAPGGERGAAAAAVTVRASAGPEKRLGVAVGERRRAAAGARRRTRTPSRKPNPGGGSMLGSSAARPL